MYLNEEKWYVYPNVSKLVSKNKMKQYERYIEPFVKKLIKVYNHVRSQSDYYCGMKIEGDNIKIYRRCAWDDFDRTGLYWWNINIRDVIDYDNNYEKLIENLETEYKNKKSYDNALSFASSPKRS